MINSKILETRIWLGFMSLEQCALKTLQTDECKLGTSVFYHNYNNNVCVCSTNILKAMYRKGRANIYKVY